MTRRMATPQPVRLPVGFQRRDEPRRAAVDGWKSRGLSGDGSRAPRLPMATPLRNAPIGRHEMHRRSGCLGNAAACLVFVVGMVVLLESPVIVAKLLGWA